MLRELEFQTEYGLIAAGAVNSSFIGRLPGHTRSLGPVVAVSYRVASRMTNTLRAGKPARSVDELDTVRLILFHSPPEQHEALTSLLRSASIQWQGKSLLFCDSDTGSADHFRRAGASIATLRRCSIPGRMLVQGSNPALASAHRLVRGLRMKAIELDRGGAAAFDAAITLGTAALTPLIDRTAGLLRDCGMRDGEAMRMAAALFEKTSRDYSHSGRQSWAWYSREPDAESLLRQIDALGSDIGVLVRDLILSGLKCFGRHPDVARRIREAPRISAP